MLEAQVVVRVFNKLRLFSLSFIFFLSRGGDKNEALSVDSHCVVMDVLDDVDCLLSSIFS